MANITTHQLLVDGPRNVVIKLSGIVDTSDVAATGTIGASGFTTSTGSYTVTFVAGALAPTVGQFLTFGDAAATFVAGTYVTSIISATSITVSNPALKINAAAAVTITGTAGAVVLLDPAKLTALDHNGTLATRLVIDHIDYNVEPLLTVNLYWEATANTLIQSLVNSGDEIDYKKVGGAWNNAGAGITGKILYTTQGWSASAVLSYTAILHCRKR